ncbi:hypothetical protein DUNSADRAFT_8793 [Dunaliella salina]|uniref:Uncharacterized protein n=1 Tax=Dunaliella salina TaxID=3046 RepID=A0ABQ7GIQ0_DUNSA|nr:hypothetical protein DUNSADRAFT_8793 [Dunaliella salina]|eukprot:KAF5834500.1 hypothetical protein DUNSADRAFT_8793 [Dunaliella salina]
MMSSAGWHISWSYEVLLTPSAHPLACACAGAGLLTPTTVSTALVFPHLSLHHTLPALAILFIILMEEVALILSMSCSKGSAG